MVKQHDVTDAIAQLHLAGRCVCVHCSLRSFGHVDGGAESILAALLSQGCTVVVPSFTYEFELPPPRHGRPTRNGIDYTTAKFSDHRPGELYSTAYTGVSKNMGAFAAAIAAHPQRIRGRHGLNSFSAIGPQAELLIKNQTPRNVYAPLKTLATIDGTVLLMGVDLTRMTLIHVAEQKAGRAPFVRWANGPDKAQLPTCVGSCSEGFRHFEPFLSPLATKRSVGLSVWRAFPAKETIDATATIIHRNPLITHCTDPGCLRCNDAVAGGAVSTS